MTKKICFVGINYGKLYEQFIPFYIYSALKTQQDSNVLVFTDNILDKNTRDMLNSIPFKGRFEVVESYNFGLPEGIFETLIPEYKRAMRWLFFDKRFEEYETMYFGDIDIYFCKEQYQIYEQHLKHCELLGLPYSNYIRASTDKIHLKHILFILFNNQEIHWREDFELIRKKYFAQNKFTGLHFIKTTEYFINVSPNMEYYIDYIIGKHHKINLLNNESILFELIKRSKLGLPPISPSNSDLDNTHPENIAFRPHHGIHLGIFRDNYLIMHERQILQSYIYQDYFKYFLSNETKDPIFLALLSRAAPFVKAVFNRMVRYSTSTENEFHAKK